MNTPDSTTPGNKFPLEGETSDPKVNEAGQDVITNKDDAVADTDGITETLSESEPNTELNADNHITNNDSAATDNLETDEQF